MNTGVLLLLCMHSSPLTWSTYCVPATILTLKTKQGSYAAHTQVSYDLGQHEATATIWGHFEGKEHEEMTQWLRPTKLKYVLHRTWGHKGGSHTCLLFLSSAKPKGKYVIIWAQWSWSMQKFSSFTFYDIITRLFNTKWPTKIRYYYAMLHC